MAFFEVGFINIEEYKKNGSYGKNVYFEKTFDNKEDRDRFLAKCQKSKKIRAVSFSYND